MTWVMLALASALLSAAAALLQKRVLRERSPLRFSLELSFAVLVLSLPMAIGAPWPASLTLAVLVGKSVLGGLAFLLVMRGLARNDVSTALPLLGLTPAVVALLAPLLLGAPLKPAEWAGLALVTAGTTLLEARDGRTLRQAWREALASGRLRDLSLAVLLFAISALADQWLVGAGRAAPRVVLVVQHAVYAALFAAMTLLAPGSRRDAPRLEPRVALLVLAVAVLTIGYRFFQLEAARFGPVALVLAVKRTSIVWASLAGARWFGESRLATRVLGAALIVAAGFLLLGRE